MKSKEKKFLTIDPVSLPKHFKAKEAEERWNHIWEEKGIYRYDPAVSREKTFVVDTPPPTVSGYLHMGHVFSYTHTDVIVRYKRMRGMNIYYPMGWDDNGLPTERRVQNYFHVKCGSELSYDSQLNLQQATAKVRKEPPKEISRKNFIELCLWLTKEDEKAFKELWRRIGLSVDWQEEYATIDDHCRHLAQLSFLDLYEKGHIYHTESPTMWDVNFQTAVAQAEAEDRLVSAAFYKIAFGVEGEKRRFVVATTRPELLPACVGVTAHPDDDRYKDLFGKRAITPLFRVPVPIFPSELADPEKGTGILMVCTFGDNTDVRWWREQNLDLRQIVGLDGRLLDITFGKKDLPSLNPEAANTYYAQLRGKTVRAGCKIIAELLRAPEGAATGTGAPLQAEPEIFTHEVKFYEKGEQPLELIPTRQWFVRLLDKKELLLEKGNQISWYPDYMKKRYLNWTENLQFDWCISRQRYFGIPIPVWYSLSEEGEPDYLKPIFADPSQLPVDPMVDTPPSYAESQRNVAGGFTGEPDVFDTWFTSSLTPQIGSHWRLNLKRYKKLYPMDIRPQAHDIIRTWAFYTIAKAALHEDNIPWKHIILSGWILDPDRKKMSKTKGNVVTPMEFVDKYTADGVRYWASKARLGADTAFDEEMLRVGRRLVTKLFNAGKFVLSQKADLYPITIELDRAFVCKLHQLVEQTSKAFEEFDFAQALTETERFFWNNFTDTYIELVKNRAKGEGKAEAGSAVSSLRFGLNIILRLFAPVLPYITEEIWSWAFVQETAWDSIHTAPWPGESDFGNISLPKDSKSFDVAVTCLGEIYRQKSQHGLSLGREIEELTIAANPKTLQRLKLVVDDVMAAGRIKRYELKEKAEVEDGQFAIFEPVFAHH